MNPVLSLLQLIRSPAVRAFEEACADVEGAQREFLLAHVRRHQDTLFGRQHGYGSIRSVDDFRQAVPVAGYDAFSPFIDKMLHGEQRVLVPEKVEFWSATAGTTGYRKLVPVTPSYRKQFQLSMHLWLHAVARDHPHATDGSVVYFVAPERVDVAPDGTLIGNMSGYNFSRVPALLRRKYAVPLAAFDVKDPVARTYAVARCALASDVSWLVAISSHPLQALFDVMASRTEDLLRDLTEGTLSVEVSPDTRRRLAPHLGRNPSRARAVARRAAAAGRLTPGAAWPHLRLLTSWTHGAGAVFLPEVMAAAPGVPVRAGMYAASEGWFTVPRQDGDVPGVLMITANFYEFIPVDDGGADAGAPLLAHQLSDRGRYNLVITTGAGLARYKMDDVVEVDGFHSGAPCLRFVQKAGSALNLYHDLTTETHVANAVAAVVAAGAPILRWALAQTPGTASGPPSYMMFVEVEGAGPDGLPDLLDHALQEANYNYRKDRTEGAIAPLQITPLRPGALARVQLARARGAHAGDQMKPVLMVKDNGVRDLLLAEGHAR